MDRVEDLRNSFSNKLLQKVPNLGSIIYFVSFTCYLFAMSLKGTMLVNFLLSERALFYLSIIPAFLVTLKIIFLDDHKWQDLTIFMLLEIILFAVGTNANEYQIFYLLFFIIGAKNIDIDKILQLFIWINLVVIVLSLIFALNGSVRNVMITRADSPAVRYSLGAVYPTDLAARGFFMMLAYTALKRFKLNIAEYISCVALTALVYFVTDTRIDLLLMLFLLICVAVYPKLSPLFAKIPAYLLEVVTILYTLAIILMGYFYHPGFWPLEKINSFLSGRLILEKVAFNDYNVPLLGQYIYQNGFGGGFKVVDYFYIDSSYVRTLMMHGIIIFALMFLLFYLLFTRFRQEKLYYWSICLLLVVLTAGIDQHMWDVSYNFVFLALFANLNGSRQLVA
ncbi:hypothetical protein [Ligilactobacillus murinus]|uniref:Polymerase n=1 Tax=Ligilactobacillus murinus TaxID=1622 RepID=A0AAD0KZA2_9LACO|nr:hypothetical protein [Ligilactobacillus murinus]HBV48390.1 hypothetical protein [Lactobacillus sp.]AWZ39153.1 hypothetical protein CPS94_09575 [Ligilactobacillus murinus]AWZ40122.1 hypothetical protein CPQ89_03240 [Ligilactobacillus murinus]MCR1896522.1 hypothetical protein [Ligilactobacillus murinus]HCM78318.1 hypothetical protein [Lactobacillus sp.]